MVFVQNENVDSSYEKVKCSKSFLWRDILIALYYNDNYKKKLIEYV